MNNCAICGKSGRLFDIWTDGDDGEEETRRFICGKCWNVIAAVAMRAVNDRLDALEIRLDEAEKLACEVKP